MSPDQFEAAYAERSGLTVEALREYRTVRRCACGEPDCDGYASVSIATVREWDAEAPAGGRIAGPVIEGRP